MMLNNRSGQLIKYNPGRAGKPAATAREIKGWQFYQDFPLELRT
jgi:hypothetical protein